MSNTDLEKMKEFLREKGQSLLNYSNVSSVGIGENKK
jgi:hypothetical protein